MRNIDLFQSHSLDRLMLFVATLGALAGLLSAALMGLLMVAQCMNIVGGR